MATTSIKKSHVIAWIYVLLIVYAVPIPFKLANIYRKRSAEENTPKYPYSIVKADNQSKYPGDAGGLSELDHWLLNNSDASYMAMYPYRDDLVARRLLSECVEAIGLTGATCERFSRLALDEMQLSKKNLRTLFHLVKQDISRVQFPLSSCAAQRYFVVPVMAACGLGCRFHMIAASISQSYMAKRVTVLHNPYQNPGLRWSSMFEPLSGCQVYYWSWQICRTVGGIVLMYLSSHPSVFHAVPPDDWFDFYSFAESKLHRYLAMPIFVDSRDSSDMFDWVDNWLNTADKSTVSVFYSYFDALFSNSNILAGTAFEHENITLTAEIARTLFQQRLDRVFMTRHSYDKLVPIAPMIQLHVNEVTLTNPDAWLTGIVISWMLDLKNDVVRSYIQKKRQGFKFQKSSSAFAAIHVRRTDKLSIEAKSYPVTDYLNELIKLISLTNTFEEVYKPPYSVYVASEDPGVIQELPRSKLFEFSFSGDRSSYQVSDRATEQSQYNLLLDIEILLESKFFVGTFSSNIGRLVAEGDHNFKVDPFLYCSSVDALWHNFYRRIFGGLPESAWGLFPS